jgi:hypothetical protein
MIAERPARALGAAGLQMEVRRQQAKMELLEGLEGKKADMRAIGDEVRRQDRSSMGAPTRALLTVHSLIRTRCRVCCKGLAGSATCSIAAWIARLASIHFIMCCIAADQRGLGQGV